MDCCITELESILRLESNEVLMIGIWGMGGIGKQHFSGLFMNDFSINLKVVAF